MLLLLSSPISSNEPRLKLTIGFMCGMLTMVHISKHNKILNEAFFITVLKTALTHIVYQEQLFKYDVLMCLTFFDDSVLLFYSWQPFYIALQRILDFHPSNMIQIQYSCRF